MTAAKNQVAAYPKCLSGDPNGTIEECLKNALDDANNKKNFVQPFALHV